MNSVLTLTQELIAFDTVNPPGNERGCALFLANLLRRGGFEVTEYEFAPERTSLLASKIFNRNKPPICLSGHLDTVPLGQADWKADPFGGSVDSGRVFGRGASDMKGGVAAIVTAALRAAARDGDSGIVLVLTAGEENGCQGARYLAGLEGVLQEAGALLVGEPTGNRPWIGHKGALWLEASTSGINAHGSMPEQGENAIYAAARAVLALERFQFSVPSHPILGTPTLNVGTIAGGTNINSVPDRAAFQIDIRTVPPLTAERVLPDLRRSLGLRYCGRLSPTPHIGARCDLLHGRIGPVRCHGPSAGDPAGAGRAHPGPQDRRIRLRRQTRGRRGDVLGNLTPLVPPLKAGRLARLPFGLKEGKTRWRQVDGCGGNWARILATVSLTSRVTSCGLEYCRRRRVPIPRQTSSLLSASMKSITRMPSSYSRTVVS